MRDFRSREIAERRAAVPETAVYFVSFERTAEERAERTAGGGGKSGSPTQRLVTLWPLDSMSFTVEKTSTVFDIFMDDIRGFTAIEEEEEEDDEEAPAASKAEEVVEKERLGRAGPRAEDKRRIEFDSLKRFICAAGSSTYASPVHARQSAATSATSVRLVIFRECICTKTPPKRREGISKVKVKSVGTFF